MTKDTSSVKPPTGAPDGGSWGKYTYRGGKTIVLAGVGFLCFCIPGCILLLFPIDSKKAYKDPNGTVSVLLFLFFSFPRPALLGSPEKIPIFVFSSVDDIDFM